jgi:hypothetical protein
LFVVRRYRINVNTVYLRYKYSERKTTFERGMTMKALFILTLAIAFSAMADAYQVFAQSSKGVKDHYGEGQWGASFEQVADSIDNCEFIPGPVSRFKILLNTGDPQDLCLIPGQTYNVRFARGDSWECNPLQVWSNVYNFTIPVSIGTTWQDSINSGGIQGVRWYRESVTRLRIQMWYDASHINYSFLVIERPNSQDLSPTTWGSIKASF